MKATLSNNAALVPLCSPGTVDQYAAYAAQIVVPGATGWAGAPAITLNILPEITDSKSAGYHDEAVIGRSFPIKKFGHGENRSINMKAHFAIFQAIDAYYNLIYLRALQSAVYPRTQVPANPYLPPTICQIRVGDLLTSQNMGFLCVVLKSCSSTYDTSVAWTDPASTVLSAYGEYLGLTAMPAYIPYKFDVDLQWDVVFPTQNLPGQEMIMSDYPQIQG